MPPHLLELDYLQQCELETPLNDSRKDTDSWTLNATVHNPPILGRPSISPARYISILYSKFPIRRGCAARVSHSSPAHGRHGTPIRSVKRCSSPPGADGCKARADQNWRFDRATKTRAHRKRNIG